MRNIIGIHRVDDRVDNKAPQPTMELEVITPEIAAEYLKRNTFNRDVGHERVKAWAKEMTDGHWDLHGDAIEFATDGTLLNGQHRLLAVVASGTTQRFWVMRNSSSSILQGSRDTGRSRTVGDTLKLHGIPNARNMAATANLLMIIHHQRRVLDNKGARGGVRFSQREILEYAQAKLDELGHSLRCASRIARPGAPRVILAVMHQLFIEASSVEDADAFYDEIGSGAQLAEDSPILLLRNRLDANAYSQNRYTQLHVAALMVKAWNAWMTGTPIRQLAWRPGGAKPEAFPKIWGHEYL